MFYFVLNFPHICDHFLVFKLFSTFIIKVISFNHLFVLFSNVFTCFINNFLVSQSSPWKEIQDDQNFESWHQDMNSNPIPISTCVTWKRGYDSLYLRFLICKMQIIIVLFNRMILRIKWLFISGGLNIVPVTQSVLNNC